jgi:hypothetical protein
VRAIDTKRVVHFEQDADQLIDFVEFEKFQIFEKSVEKRVEAEELDQFGS